MFIRHLFAGLLVCLVSAGLQAQTVATASAALTNIRIELVDLNPGDGIAPGFGPAFVGAGLALAQADAGIVMTGDLERVVQLGSFTSLPIDAAAASVSSGLYLANAARGGDSLTTSAHAGLARAVGAYAWFSSGTADAITGPGEPETFTGSFVITPFTELRLSADYAFSAGFSAALSGATQGVATLYGAVGLASETGVGAPQYLREWALASATAADPAASASGSLTLVLSNPSDAGQALYFGAAASSYADVSLVPEPSSLLMMAGGLLVGMLAARRHQRRAGLPPACGPSTTDSRHTTSGGKSRSTGRLEP